MKCEPGGPREDPRFLSPFFRRLSGLFAVCRDLGFLIWRDGEE